MNVSAPVKAQPETTQDSGLLQILEHVEEKTRRRRSSENWLIAFMVVCSCLFVVALGTFVLVPTIHTVTAATPHTTSTDGP